MGAFETEHLFFPRFFNVPKVGNFAKRVRRQEKLENSQEFGSYRFKDFGPYSSTHFQILGNFSKFVDDFTKILQVHCRNFGKIAMFETPLSPFSGVMRLVGLLLVPCPPVFRRRHCCYFREFDCSFTWGFVG